MKVHTSNYVVTGFTCAVPEAELARIAHAARSPVRGGSRQRQPDRPFRVRLCRGNRRRRIRLRAGADVVTFSGDKLLGGPQAGLIVGKAEWIRKIKKHPLKRALRVSKLTLAALQATLALYRHPEQLIVRLPTLRLLTRPPREIEALAKRAAPVLARAVGPAFEVRTGPVRSQIGSGSLPVAVLPSAGLVVRCCQGGKGKGRRLNALAGALRALPVPVIGRIVDDALILDLRTLTDEAAFVAQLPKIRLGVGEA